MGKLRKLKAIIKLVPLAVLAVPMIGAAYLLRPMPDGKKLYIRIEPSQGFAPTLRQLEAKGVLRSAWAAGWIGKLTLRDKPIEVGTYQFRPGMSVLDILRDLRRPVRQDVRIPETNWARRTANLLEQKGVCSAEEYMALVRNPKSVQSLASFPLPKDSLEGYLYPDTYDLPPLLGAQGVVKRQLAAFQDKIFDVFPEKQLPRLLKVASLVELETGSDEERAIIAGVIENRLKRNMYLQIDAGILYGLQKWRRLTYRDYREVDSPYNLYRHKGLPPTPICSPSLKSIQAAMKPAQHNYLYYVVVPGEGSVFAATYKEHLANIKLRRQRLADQEKAQGDATK